MLQVVVPARGKWRWLLPFTLVALAGIVLGLVTPRAVVQASLAVQASPTDQAISRQVDSTQADDVAQRDVLTKDANYARAGSGNGAISGSGSSTTAKTSAAETVDVSVQKSESSGTPAPGGDLSYSLRVTVQGVADATDVVVTDTLPPSFTYVTYSGSSMSPDPDDPHVMRYNSIKVVPSLVDNLVTWRLGNLIPGTVVRLYPWFHIGDDVPVGAYIQNTVSATTSANETDCSNNVAIASVRMEAPTVDLSVQSRFRSSHAWPDGQLPYSIDVHNWGNSAAHNVIVTDTLPISATLLSWSGSIWPGYVNAERVDLSIVITPTVNGREVVWQLGELPSAGSAYIALLASLDPNVTPGTTITNIAQVSTSDAELDYQHNVGSAAHTLITDLAVQQIVPWSPLIPGGMPLYSIEVQNKGSFPLHDVVLTNTLPVSSTYLSYSGTFYDPHVGENRELVVTPSIIGDQVMWPLGTLLASGYASIVPKIRLGDDVLPGTTVSNTVEVGARELEVISWNNVGVVVRAVSAPFAELKVQTWLSSGRSAPGSDMEYTIGVRNEGNGSASGVIVTETIPVSSSFVSYWGYYYDSDYHPLEVQPSRIGNQVSWPIGTLAASGFAYLFPTIRLDDGIPESTTLIHRADATTRDQERDYYSNTSYHSTATVRSTADVFASSTLLPTYGQPAPGSTLRYQVAFGNQGVLTAHDVVLTDTLPSYADYISYTGSLYNPDFAEITVNPTVVGNSVVWRLGSLGPGAYGYLYPTVHFADSLPIGSQVQNQVDISTSDAEAIVSNNSAKASGSAVSVAADLTVDTSLTVVRVSAGKLLRPTIYVGSRSNASVHDVVVTDTLPISTSYVSWSGHAYNPDYVDLTQTTSPAVSGRELVWNLGSLVASGYAYLYPIFRVDDDVPVGTEVTNVASVGTSDAESGYASSTNNMKSVTRVVGPPISWDMQLSMPTYSWSPSGHASPGETFGDEIAFSNQGDFVAHDVTITDSLPISTSFVSYTGYYYDPDYHTLTVAPRIVGNQVIWSLGSLGPGAFGYLYPSIRVGRDVPSGSHLVNTAVVSTSDSEADYWNNAGIHTRAVIASRNPSWPHYVQLLQVSRNAASQSVPQAVPQSLSLLQRLADGIGSLFRR